MRALVSALERDPGQRWRWGVGAVLGLGLVGVGAFLAASEDDDEGEQAEKDAKGARGTGAERHGCLLCVREGAEG